MWAVVTLSGHGLVLEVAGITRGQILPKQAAGSVDSLS